MWVKNPLIIILYLYKQYCYHALRLTFPLPVIAPSPHPEAILRIGQPQREYGKKVVAVRVCLYHMWTPSLLKARMDPTSCNTMQLFEWVFPPEEQDCDFPVLFSLSLLMVCSACWSWKEWVTILGPFGNEAAVVYINRLANLNSQLFAVSLEVWALSGNLTSFSSCSYAERWWKWHDGMWLSELRICTPFGD